MSAPVHVEIVQKKTSLASKEFIKEKVHRYIMNLVSIMPGATLGRELEDVPELRLHVQSIGFCDEEHDGELGPRDAALRYHVFRLAAFSCREQLASATLWTLPGERFHGLWESLVYDSRLKADLLRVAEAALLFPGRGVDPHAVCVNRLVLLHGPAGTGKTSLCRALAHKLAARLGERFPRARLFEFNAHGPFAERFSESGQLAARLSARVAQLAEDPRLLTVVLLDGVEALGAGRAALGEPEPPAAVLAALDSLRHLPNALLLATSNAPGAVDAAFVDRADVKRLVPLPSARAAYAVLRGCCAELQARGVLAPGALPPPLRELEAAHFVEAPGTRGALRLERVAHAAAAARLSGRALRRLPFLALALHTGGRAPPPLEPFVEALEAALWRHAADADELRTAAEAHAEGAGGRAPPPLEPFVEALEAALRRHVADADELRAVAEAYTVAADGLRAAAESHAVAADELRAAAESHAVAADELRAAAETHRPHTEGAGEPHTDASPPFESVRVKSEVPFN